jgi:glutamate transport system permease protein
MTSVLYDVPGPKARRNSRIASLVGALVILAAALWGVTTLARQGLFNPDRWDIFSEAVVWQFLLQGIGATLSAAALAAVIAAVLAFGVALLRMSDIAWIRVPATVVLEFLRGMPVVLMMFFILLVFGSNAFVAVVAGLALYNAAIFAEILRAGIQSLPKGQREAGLAIGLTSFKTRVLVELPQAVRRMLPSLVAQLVVLLKDTSLGYIVTYEELLRKVNILSDFYGAKYLFSVFFVGAALYILINLTVSRIAIWIERRGSKKTAGGMAAASTSVRPTAESTAL